MFCLSKALIIEDFQGIAIFIEFFRRRLLFVEILPNSFSCLFQYIYYVYIFRVFIPIFCIEVIYVSTYIIKNVKTNLTVKRGLDATSKVYGLNQSTLHYYQ